MNLQISKNFDKKSSSIIIVNFQTFTYQSRSDGATWWERHDVSVSYMDN